MAFQFFLSALGAASIDLDTLVLRARSHGSYEYDPADQIPGVSPTLRPSKNATLNGKASNESA
jgi:hypothetical protein